MPMICDLPWPRLPVKSRLETSQFIGFHTGSKIRRDASGDGNASDEAFPNAQAAFRNRIGFQTDSHICIGLPAFTFFPISRFLHTPPILDNSEITNHNIQIPFMPLGNVNLINCNILNPRSGPFPDSHPVRPIALHGGARFSPLGCLTEQAAASLQLPN